jgi:aryl-alcohol dehydrogenase-like predicted oxidoreductase
MPACARLGMGLTVWSPLAQGLLTGKYNDGLPAGSRGSTSEWLRGDMTEANLVKVRRLTDVAGELGLTMMELALAWVLRRPEISCAITGATRPEHVRANVTASDVELTTETLETIEIILG